LGGVAVCSTTGRRYGARFCVCAPDLAAALDYGIGSFRQATAKAGLANSPVVRLEAPVLADVDEAILNVGDNSGVFQQSGAT
jgi:hypothetical protein